MEGYLRVRAITAIAAFAAAAAFGSAAPAFAFKACAVTDTGGVDDKGFNQNTWAGVQAAAKKGGFDAKLLESKAETDYVPNINSFVGEKCDVIVTVGFLLGDATKAAAEANAGTKFTIVDYAYNPTIPNVLGQVYATNQAAFLAGYLAAGVSKTGTVGTFGGINIGPPVTDFKEGLFTGNFNSLDDGKAFAKNLNDEGADVVMPVAGKVGQGSAALAAELGVDKLKIIGVDTDQYLTDPDHKGVFLSSVLKQVGSTTATAVTEAFDGSFKGGVLVGDLKSGGVGIAPAHDLASSVPADLQGELDAIAKGIVDGSIKVGG